MQSKNYFVSKKFGKYHISATRSKISRILFALCVLLCGLIASLDIQAATITVTNTSDAGAGSLRNAMAIAADSDDTIDFNLSGCPCTINLTSGQILTEKSLAINGPGADMLTISGNNTSRIFNLGAVSDLRGFIINDLTIADGNTAGNGGGILNTGKLTINNSVIRNSTASGLGGGIVNGNSPESFAFLTINNSEISFNISGGGGGLFIFGGDDPRTSQSSRAIINNTNFSNNSATEGGAILNSGILNFNGGIVNLNQATNGGGIANGFNSNNTSDGGSTILERAIIEQNTATGDGGGIYNIDNTAANPTFPPDLTIRNSTVSGNQAANGGGIRTRGIFSISNTTVSNNTATTNGGGIHNTFNVTSTADTFSGNTARRGGGIYNTFSVTLTNSTMSGNQATGNTATDGGGAIFNDFDGVSTSTVTLLNSTIAGNSAVSRGGGVFNPVTMLVSQNTIFAQNTAPTGPDINGNLSSNGFNLIGNTSGSGGFDPSDLQNINPNLGALTDNGGPTETRALLPGSPAINAGTNSGAPNTDQRGVSRPMGGTTDIGAFEVSFCGTGEVTNTNDDGIGSLRCAIAASFTGDSIDFNLPNGSVITLASEILIDKPIKLNGNGADQITVSGNNSVRVFRINAPTTIFGLTIANGRALTLGDRNGGGIFNNSSLKLIECVVNGKQCRRIWRRTLFARRQRCGNNRQHFFNEFGGARRRDLQRRDGTTNDLRTARFPATQQPKAAVFIRKALNTFTIITNATIAGNTGDGGGINGGATIKNTIIAGNTGTRPDVFGSFISNGFNLIGNTNGGSGFIASDLQNVNPMLGALGNYGGNTPTMALLTGSPAIDKGGSADFPESFSSLKSQMNKAKNSVEINSLRPIDTDQRGFNRPIDNPAIPNAVGGNGSDIGAFEVQAPTAAAVSVGGRVLTAKGRGISRVRVVLTMPNGELKTALTNSFGYYRFTDIPVGETYIFTVRHKQYIFRPQVLTISDAVENLNFTSLTEP